MTVVVYGAMVGLPRGMIHPLLSSLVLDHTRVHTGSMTACDDIFVDIRATVLRCCRHFPSLRDAEVSNNKAVCVELIFFI